MGFRGPQSSILLAVKWWAPASRLDLLAGTVKASPEKWEHWWSVLSYGIPCFVYGCFLWSQEWGFSFLHEGKVGSQSNEHFSQVLEFLPQHVGNPNQFAYGWTRTDWETVPNLTPVRNIDPHNVGPPVRSWFITPHEHCQLSLYFIFWYIFDIMCTILIEVIQLYLCTNLATSLGPRF